MDRAGIEIRDHRPELEKSVPNVPTRKPPEEFPNPDKSSSISVAFAGRGTRTIRFLGERFGRSIMELNECLEQLRYGDFNIMVAIRLSRHRSLVTRAWSGAH